MCVVEYVVCGCVLHRVYMVFPMCSFQIYVLFVLMRVDISLFNSGILGSCGVFLLVKFLCSILLRILPTGMCSLPAL